MFFSLPAVATVLLLAGCLQQMNAERQTVAIEVTVPDPAWQVTIDEIYVSKDRLLVVSTLSRDPDVMAAQVISKARDSVTIAAPKLPLEHYVLGKTFRWAQESHHFIQDRKELEKALKEARRIYRRKE